MGSRRLLPCPAHTDAEGEAGQADDASSSLSSDINCRTYALWRSRPPPHHFPKLTTPTPPPLLRVVIAAHSYCPPLVAQASVRTSEHPFSLPTHKSHCSYTLSAIGTHAAPLGPGLGEVVQGCSCCHRTSYTHLSSFHDTRSLSIRYILGHPTKSTPCLYQYRAHPRLRPHRPLLRPHRLHRQAAVQPMLL